MSSLEYRLTLHDSQRMLAPLDGDAKALPVFKDYEHFYRWTTLTPADFMAKTMEFSRSQK